MINYQIKLKHYSNFIMQKSIKAIFNNNLIYLDIEGRLN
jgi:hypothetical protein